MPDDQPYDQRDPPGGERRAAEQAEHQVPPVGEGADQWTAKVLDGLTRNIEYPTIGSQHCDMALVYNFVDKTVSFRVLPQPRGQLPGGQLAGR